MFSFMGQDAHLLRKTRLLKNLFNFFFKNAKISIRHDIDAACYAMYNGNPNITCILGTGSNSCFYDGYSIFENAPSLGFLLGDEASGNYFGKKLLTLYFNKALPKDLSRKFEEGFETNLPIVKENLYGNNRANVYLSKYFPFVSENKNHTMIKDLIYNSLDEFFNLHVCCFKNHTEVEINFIGSVAYFLSDEIKIIAKKYNCKVGSIIKDPIYNLVDFHFDKIKTLEFKETFLNN